MEEILVPITMFATIPVTVWAVSYYRYKSRSRVADTVQSLVASGQSVDETLIKSLTLFKRHKHSDLRSGMIAIAIGFGFFFLGNAIPEPEAKPAMAAIGSFPILIGVALLAFWFVVGRKETE